jgi:hypothetical protein
LPDAPSATTDPDSTSISMPWSNSPVPLPLDSPKAPCKPFSNNKLPPWASNSPVPNADGLVPSAAGNALSTFGAHNCNKANRFATVPTAAGTFSPQRPILRLDGHGYSPGLLQHIVTAGGRLHSFADAAFALSLSGLSISARHVQQLTREVGTDLAQARDEQAQKRRRRQLSPRVAVTPEVVAVEVDGGRLRTRATDSGRGVHAAENKEDKIACLVTLTNNEHAADPQPEPPPSFVQPRRIQRLVRQMAGQASDPRAAADAPAEEPEAEAAAPPTAALVDPQAEPWSPRRLVRTCVASMVRSRSFGPLLAAEAQSRGFYAARRRAFVADGQAYNWSIHRGYFADFVPVVDLLHVVCYLFKAAQAVEAEAERWPLYLRWLRSCWQGQVAEVVTQMERYQETWGRPPPGEELAATDPRRVLAEALSYLRNNAGRMDYPRYRQEGLPTTSSLVESLVGEFNARVKGKQKFWNRPAGAEAVLQVRAALLSEDGRLERYFAERPGSPYRRRAA